jgi:hypothetical protein
VRLDDAELTYILWREKCVLISAFSGARTTADVTKCGHDLESSLRSTKWCINQADHAPVRKYIMSKLANNREIVYFQTAVLAEPSDLRIFFSTTPDPTAWIWYE